MFVRWVAATLLAAGTFGCLDDSSETGLTAATGNESAELSGITAAHNATRSEVGVAALQWNPQLAALAGQFIADCQFDHSSTQQRSNQAGFIYIGENLFMSGGGAMPTGKSVADAWAQEKSAYDHGSNSCSGVCGHYTQQVWRTTTDLGCAMKSCGGGYIVACEYGPGGNYSGESPY